MYTLVRSINKYSFDNPFYQDFVESCNIVIWFLIGTSREDSLGRPHLKAPSHKGAIVWLVQDVCMVEACTYKYAKSIFSAELGVWVSTVMMANPSSQTRKYRIVSGLRLKRSCLQLETEGCSAATACNSSCIHGNHHQLVVKERQSRQRKRRQTVGLSSSKW